MVTATQVAQARSANRGLVTLARRDLAAFWSTLDLTRPEAARNALLTFTPALTTQYGEVAATIAADWYDDLRAAEPVRPGFQARVADPVPAVAVERRTRFGAGHLFTETPAAMLPFLAGIVDEYVRQPGRLTIAQSAAADPARPRWARVPSGLETCDWCLMLSSRGFVYHSRDAAMRSEVTKFHANCDCELVPTWDAQPRLDGYDPDALRRQWRAAQRGD